MLLAAAVFARPASACAPAPLLASTVKAATLVSQGVKLRDVVSPFAAQVVGVHAVAVLKKSALCCETPP